MSVRRIRHVVSAVTVLLSVFFVTIFAQFSPAEAALPSGVMIISILSTGEGVDWYALTTPKELGSHLATVLGGAGKPDIYLRVDRMARFEDVSSYLDVIIRSGTQTIKFGTPAIPGLKLVPVTPPDGPTISVKIAPQTSWSASRPRTVRVFIDFDGSLIVNGLFKEGAPLEQLLAQFPRSSTILITVNKVARFGPVVNAARSAQTNGFKDVVIVSGDATPP